VPQPSVARRYVRFVLSARGTALSSGRAVVLLCRPLNLLGIGLAVATSIKLAGGGRAFDGTDVAVVAGWVLLAAGGYLIDEARDSECDARFHPTRPIPSGLVSRKLAFRIGTGLLAAGATVLVFGYTGIWVVGAAAALVLYGYGDGLKRVSGLAANATISALLALALMSGGFRSGEWRAVAVLALIVFWTNLGREIIMDIVDLEADRYQEFRTIPLIHGVRTARSLAGVFLILGGCSGYLLTATGSVSRPDFAIGLTVVNVGLASTVVLPLMLGRGDPRRLVVFAKAVMFAYLVLTALQLR
jgi:4-hydroxybenzoate polyprenyltransferase